MIKIAFYLIFFFFSLYSQAQKTLWSTKIDSVLIFSSPRFTDLNHDAILDVVIGAGNEKYPTANGIVAIDGKSGNVLWNVGTPNQIYTSALFEDLTDDGVEDIIIGGRNATLYAINGSNGEIIWQFWKQNNRKAREANVFNFFTTQLVDDENSDGYKDVLISNGGDAYAKPGEKKRPWGRILLLSGKDGNAITEAKLPEAKEIYYAPHVHFNYGIDSAAIIFGTGGEDISGKLYEVSMTELLNKDISKARILLSDTLKGFIVNSAMVDLNGDAILDIVNARINGTISAVDGRTHTIIWEHFFPNTEGYVAPTIGHFTDDETPDVFVTMAHGTYPFYDSFTQLIIEGATGKIRYNETAGFSQFSSAIAVDVNNDKWDELIYIQNEFDTTTHYISNQFKIIDFNNGSEYCIGAIRDGMSISSTPGIVDLNCDGKLELVFAYASSPSSDKEFSTVECIQLDFLDNDISFPGYLGTYQNGIFIKKSKL